MRNLLTNIANVEDLQSTLCLVFNSAFSLARSPSVVTSLVEILNDTLERSIQAQVEGMSVFASDF